MKNTNFTASLSSKCKYSIAEIVFGHNLTATECEENATMFYLLESLDIQPRIALQCIAECRAMFRKRWRIQDDEIILAFIGIQNLNASSQKAMTESPGKFISTFCWSVRLPLHYYPQNEQAEHRHALHIQRIHQCNKTY